MLVFNFSNLFFVHVPHTSIPYVTFGITIFCNRFLQVFWQVRNWLFLTCLSFLNTFYRPCRCVHATRSIKSINTLVFPLLMLYQASHSYTLKKALILTVTLEALHRQLFSTQTLPHLALHIVVCFPSSS